MIIASKYLPSKLHFRYLEDLMNDHQYIGFHLSNVDDDDIRYMVVTGGDQRGCAVSPTGTWCSREEQQTYKEGYVIFETKEDLFEWMKG